MNFMPARQYVARQPADFTDPGADPCTDSQDVNDELAVMFKDDAIVTSWLRRSSGMFAAMEMEIFTRLTREADKTACADWREIAFDWFSDDSDNRQEALRRVISRQNLEAEEAA